MNRKWFENSKLSEIFAFKFLTHKERRKLDYSRWELMDLPVRRSEGYKTRLQSIGVEEFIYAAEWRCYTVLFLGQIFIFFIVVFVASWLVIWEKISGIVSKQHRRIVRP